MEERIEELEKRIADGLEAVRELKRLKAEEPKARPKFRLIKGGLVGAGIWAGVEWIRNYKRVVVALTATGITVAGAVIAEDPGSPGADPPSQVITHPPPSVPTKRPTAVPTARPSPTPQRTSPQRTQAPMRIPPAAPSSTPAKTKEPTQVRTRTPTETPTEAPVVSLPVTPTITPSAAVETITALPCAIDLLGVKLCLPLG